jgi:hypothetical protein
LFFDPGFELTVGRPVFRNIIDYSVLLQTQAIEYHLIESGAYGRISFRQSTFSVERDFKPEPG